MPVTGCDIGGCELSLWPVLLLPARLSSCLGFKKENEKSSFNQAVQNCPFQNKHLGWHLNFTICVCFPCRALILYFLWIPSKGMEEKVDFSGSRDSRGHSPAVVHPSHPVSASQHLLGPAPGSPSFRSTVHTDRKTSVL